MMIYPVVQLPFILEFANSISLHCLLSNGYVDQTVMQVTEWIRSDLEPTRLGVESLYVKNEVGNISFYLHNPCYYEV